MLLMTFECHTGWSRHDTYIRVALAEDDLNVHTVWLWNKMTLPVATILRTVDIQGRLRMSANNMNTRNIVLIDRPGCQNETVGWWGAGQATAADGWRNRWCMDVLRDADTEQQDLTPRSFLPRRALNCVKQWDHELHPLSHLLHLDLQACETIFSS